MISVSWDRDASADTPTRRGYRWTVTSRTANKPGEGAVTVPIAWSHQVDTITAEVTAAATEQLGGPVTVHEADDVATAAAARQAVRLPYLEHPRHERDLFWVSLHAGHQTKLSIWRGEHQLGGAEYVLATSGANTLHRIDCPGMRDRVHGSDLMNRIRRLRETAELGNPGSIDTAHLDELDVDATLAWIWRGPRPQLLTAADAAWMPPPPATCQRCLPTYHLPAEQPPLPPADDTIDERHLGHRVTSPDGTDLGILTAISRRTRRDTEGHLRVDTTLEFSTGHHHTLDADSETPSANPAPRGVG